MTLRKLLLRVMLAALAAAACSGVLAIVVPRADFTWRLAAMSGVAAVAAAFMLAMSKWVDNRDSRPAGLFGMCLCVLQFVLAVVLIWGNLLSPGSQEFIGLSMLMFAAVGIPSILAVRMVTSPTSRIGGMLGLSGLALALACLLYASADEAFNIAGGDDRWWQTGWSIYFPALLTALCMVGLARPDPRKWRWVGVLGASAALGMSMYGIWIKSSDDPTPLAIAYALGAVVAHTILCFRLSIPDSTAWVRIGTVVAAAATGGLVCGVIHFDSDWNDPYGLARLATGAGIIAASGTLAQLVLARMNRRVDVDRQVRGLKTISVDCPRCHRTLVLAINGGSCPECRILFKIEVESPWCLTCNYDLTGITSDKCPECGTRISRTSP